MVLAAYTTHGWVQVWTLPLDPAAQPETDEVPGNPFSVYASETVSQKGKDVPWAEWAARLAGRSPYGYWFAVVDVPSSAGPGVGAALFWLRHQDGLFPP